jgi:hypothetical protein
MWIISEYAVNRQDDQADYISRADRFLLCRCRAGVTGLSGWTYFQWARNYFKSGTAGLFGAVRSRWTSTLPG